MLIFLKIVFYCINKYYYDEKEYIYDYKYFCELKNNIVWRGGGML